MTAPTLPPGVLGEDTAAAFTVVERSGVRWSALAWLLAPPLLAAPAALVVLHTAPTPAAAVPRLVVLVVAVLVAGLVGSWWHRPRPTRPVTAGDHVHGGLRAAPATVRATVRATVEGSVRATVRVAGARVVRRVEDREAR